jgi:hypothetical protein
MRERRTATRLLIARMRDQLQTRYETALPTPLNGKNTYPNPGYSSNAKSRLVTQPDYQLARGMAEIGKAKQNAHMANDTQRGEEEDTEEVKALKEDPTAPVRPPISSLLVTLTSDFADE